MDLDSFSDITMRTCYFRKHSEGVRMDRLPKRKGLVFNRARKTLYLQLTTAIRSLGSKFPDTIECEWVCRCVNEVGKTTNLQRSRDNRVSGYAPCIIAEIKRVIPHYQYFLTGGNGDGRCTKKLRAGIARLEWLRDNWDALEVTGNSRNGYSLRLKDETEQIL